MMKSSISSKALTATAVIVVSAFLPSKASAFVPAPVGTTTNDWSRQSRTIMPKQKKPLFAEENAAVFEGTQDTITNGIKRKPAMSTAIPFLACPAALDGTLAGDVGFDPLGFASSKEQLMNYREAEIKHSRLAMLAAVGWPISEIFDKQIAAAWNLPAAVDASDRAPALLNGGLDEISPFYWGGILGAAAAIDLYGINRAKNAAMDGTASIEYRIPGDLGFDPLGLYPKTIDGQQQMQLAEIKHGRLAMIAIFAFAVQEFVSKIGVIDQTPIFFKPLF